MIAFVRSWRRRRGSPAPVITPAPVRQIDPWEQARAEALGVGGGQWVADITMPAPATLEIIRAADGEVIATGTIEVIRRVAPS